MTKRNTHKATSVLLPRAAEKDGVYVWRTMAGEYWLCAEYDHGPFCRRCQRVSERNGIKLLEALSGR